MSRRNLRSCRRQRSQKNSALIRIPVLGIKQKEDIADMMDIADTI
jgi:hypothetical protein